MKRQSLFIGYVLALMFSINPLRAADARKDGGCWAKLAQLCGKKNAVEIIPQHNPTQKVNLLRYYQEKKHDLQRETEQYQERLAQARRIDQDRVRKHDRSVRAQKEYAERMARIDEDPLDLNEEKN